VRALRHIGVIELKTSLGSWHLYDRWRGSRIARGVSDRVVYPCPIRKNLKIRSIP
jgi:hypothetical protein